MSSHNTDLRFYRCATKQAVLLCETAWTCCQQLGVGSPAEVQARTGNPAHGVYLSEANVVACADHSPQPAVLMAVIEHESARYLAVGNRAQGEVSDGIEPQPVASLDLGVPDRADRDAPDPNWRFQRDRGRASTRSPVPGQLT
jgi:hypothetical protein